MSRGKHKRTIPDRVRRAIGLRSSSAASPVDRKPTRGKAKRQALRDQED